MKRLFSVALAAAVLAGSAYANTSIRIIPKPTRADIDGPAMEMKIKRFPEGKEFILSVNKNENVSHFTIQWFKDGQLLPGENAQDLRRPIATTDLDGIYTVTMSSPCATVESKPIRVIVGRMAYPIQTQIGDDVIAGVNETMAATFELRECQPNPVTDRATITFVTREASPVTLKVVDLNGNVVATLVNETLSAGQHEVVLNTREHNMSNSLYYYVLTAPGYTDSKPLMMVK